MTLLEQFQLWLVNIWPGWAAYIVPGIVGIVIVLGFLLVMVLVFIWYERRLLGRFQVRLGPNRLGPEGIFQPIATAVKILLKEDIIPAKSDKVIHWLAPVIVFVPVLMIFAVVPFGQRAILADLNVGIVYVVAISSISAVGIYMAGWASNNKYGLIAALRVVAQVVSYEAGGAGDSGCGIDGRVAVDDSNRSFSEYSLPYTAASWFRYLFPRHGGGDESESV